MSSDTQDGVSHENNSFDDPSRREFVKSVGAGLGGVLLGASSLTGCGGSASNQSAGDSAQAGNLVIRENSRSGDAGWEPANVTTTRNIEGYTTRDSVNPGDPLEFCVSSGSSDYAIDLYRLGWYDGVGARKVHTISGSNGSQQSVPEPEGSEMLITCDWPVTDSVTVPSEWTTGLYYAIFRSGGEATACPFVVREETPSARMLVQLPFHTQQAYKTGGRVSGR